MNQCTRPLLYLPSAKRIPRRPIYNRRQHLRHNILRRHWIPRTPRHNRNFIPPSLPSTNHKSPLLIRPPLWVRSRRLILTLRRRSMNFLVPLHLLMRLIKRSPPKLIALSPRTKCSSYQQLTLSTPPPSHSYLPPPP